MPNIVKRGTVWWVDLPLDTNTRVQGGLRPCVVVSSEYVMKNSDTVLICPLTTHLDAYKLHPKVFLNKIGQIICDQIMTVDKNQLQDYEGYISDVEMSAVDMALRKMFGFE